MVTPNLSVKKKGIRNKKKESIGTKERLIKMKKLPKPQPLGSTSNHPENYQDSPIIVR